MAAGGAPREIIPGILTGVAALITAVTGLVVAFNHTGNRSGDARPVSQPLSAAVPASAPSGSRASGGAAGAGGAQTIALPALNRVKLAVRYLNGGRHPANFWSASYRLLVDDVPRAPTNSLNEVVAGESAKEGEVVFELPVSVKDVVLQISSGDERSRIPLTLP